MARPRKSLEERFWKMVQKTKRCWLWTGRVDRDGYGQISLGGEGGRRVRATAASWLIETGALPVEQVLHRCDTPQCVRPAHLFEGDQAANMADMVAKKRSLKGHRHHQAVLTEDAVREIRASPETGVALARRFGVSPSTVSLVKKRKNWSHVQ